MKFKWLACSLVILVAMSGCSKEDSTQKEPIIKEKNMQMKLTSAAFEHQTPIPAKYTCEGEGIAPALSWNDVPKHTKSFVLIMDDPDAVSGIWDHWVTYDIPAHINSLAEGGVLPEGAKTGKSTNGKKAYVGPCPPKGSGLHNYTFKLYALDIEQITPKGESKTDIENAMQGHILSETKLIGTYEKKKKFLFF